MGGNGGPASWWVRLVQLTICVLTGMAVYLGGCLACLELCLVLFAYRFISWLGLELYRAN